MAMQKQCSASAWWFKVSAVTASLMHTVLVPLVAKFPHLCLYKEALLQLFPPSSPDPGIRVTIVPYPLDHSTILLATQYSSFTVT